MGKLPIISGKNLLKILKSHGYKMIRQKGSHVFIEKDDLSTIIPVHSNEDLGKGLLKSILNDLELTIDDLDEMLK